MRTPGRNSNWISDCPLFIRDIVAKQIGVSIETVDKWIENEDVEGIELVEIAILYLAETARNLRSAQDDQTADRSDPTQYPLPSSASD